MKNNTIRLRNKPVGLPQLTDFALVEETVPVVDAGEVLLKSVYVLSTRICAAKWPELMAQVLKQASLFLPK